MGIMRERDCPTSSNEFIMTYNQIKNDLESEITLITNRQDRLEEDLLIKRQEQQTITKREEQQTEQLRNNLQQQENERYRLLDDKRRVEAQLIEINDNLRKTEMFIEDTQTDIDRIASSFKPKQDRLHSQMQDHQFGIAGFTQELSVYSELLSIGNDSYNLLDSYSHSVNKDVGDRQSDLENNYVNYLATYLDGLCRAKLMVTDRVELLKQHVEALKRTNETANNRYARSYNINDQLQQCGHHIDIDEETSVSITAEILNNIEKAQKAISAPLFDKFINHIGQHETGKLVDLSKYVNMSKMNNMMMNQMHNGGNVNRGMNNVNNRSSRNMNVS